MNLEELSISLLPTVEEETFDIYKDFSFDQFEHSRWRINSKLVRLDQWGNFMEAIVDKSSFRLLLDDIGELSTFPILLYLRVKTLTARRRAAFVYCLSKPLGRVFYFHMRESFTQKYTTLAEKFLPDINDEKIHISEKQLISHTYVDLLTAGHTLTVEDYRKYKIEGVLLCDNFHPELFHEPEFLELLISTGRLEFLSFNSSVINSVIAHFHSVITIANCNFFALMYAKYFNIILSLRNSCLVESRIVTTIEKIYDLFGLSSYITSSYTKDAKNGQSYSMSEIFYLLGLTVDDSCNTDESRKNFIYDSATSVLSRNVEQLSSHYEWVKNENIRKSNEILIEKANETVRDGSFYYEYLPCDIVRIQQHGKLYHFLRREAAVIVKDQINPYTNKIFDEDQLSEIQSQLDRIPKISFTSEIKLKDAATLVENSLFTFYEGCRDLLKKSETTNLTSYSLNFTRELLIWFLKDRLLQLAKTSSSPERFFCDVCDLSYFSLKKFSVVAPVSVYHRRISERVSHETSTVPDWLKEHLGELLASYKDYLESRYTPCEKEILQDQLYLYYIRLAREFKNKRHEY